MLTATRFIGEAALAAGLDVVVGQLHGMSQRGGSVSSTVLIGPGKSSFIADGQADVVLGLEPLETLRALPRMAGHTKVVMNLGRVMPGVLSRQGKPYPAIEEILDQIRAVAASVHTVDAGAAAEKNGGTQGLNVLMLGALSALNLLPLTEAQLLSAIERRSSKKSLGRNRQAFALGRKAMGK